MEVEIHPIDSWRVYDQKTGAAIPFERFPTGVFDR